VVGEAIFEKWFMAIYLNLLLLTKD
jgi:hypothetical protein